MLILAQGLDQAIQHGLPSVLGVVVVALASTVVWLYRDRLAIEKAHRDEITKLKDTCKEELLKLSSDYRTTTEVLMREQIQIISGNNLALKDVVEAIRRPKSGRT